MASLLSGAPQLGYIWKVTTSLFRSCLFDNHAAKPAKNGRNWGCDRLCSSESFVRPARRCVRQIVYSASVGLSPPYKSEKLAKSCTSVATSAEQAELFRVVREGHPIPESTCWTSPIVIQPVEKRPFWSNGKKHVFLWKLAPRTRKRLTERIPETLSDFALLIAGDTPSLAACFFSIRGRVSGTEK